MRAQFIWLNRMDIWMLLCQNTFLVLKYCLSQAHKNLFLLYYWPFFNDLLQTQERVQRWEMTWKKIIKCILRIYSNYKHQGLTYILSHSEDRWKTISVARTQHFLFQLKHANSNISKDIKKQQSKRKRDQRRTGTEKKGKKKKSSEQSWFVR